MKPTFQRRVYSFLGGLLLLAAGFGWSVGHAQVGGGGVSNSAPSFAISGPTSNQCLLYNSTTRYWANGACSGGSGVPTGANPTGTIGLTAVNGSALTFLRSDGAPALSQAIVPTWTGLHTWSSTEPRLLLNESDVGANLKLWDFDVSASVLTGRTRTDADGAGKNWLAVTRGATTALASITIGNASDNPQYNFLGSGGVDLGTSTVTAGGTYVGNSSGDSFRASASNPTYIWRDTSDAGANRQRWHMQVDSGTGILKLGTATNADAYNTSALAITRGAASAAITNIALGNATDNPTYSFLGTGITTFNGNVTLAATKEVNATYFTTAGSAGDQINIRSNTGVLRFGASDDVILARDAANTLALRNSTTTQKFNVYDTYTDASNYSRIFSTFSSGYGQIGVQAAGTGSGGLNGLLFYNGSTASFGLSNNLIAQWTVKLDGSFLAGTDNSYDIGASGANRPRSIYVGTNINAGGTMNLPGLTSSSAATTGTLCWTTGTGNVNVDTTTTCLLSARKYKQNIFSLPSSLNTIMALRPVSYELKPEFDPTHIGEQVGFIADEVATVDPRLVSFDEAGDPHAMRYQQLTALLTKAMQEQQLEITSLKARLTALESK